MDLKIIWSSAIIYLTNIVVSSPDKNRGFYGDYSPFKCSNIPAVPAYGVYISQLIRNSRDFGSYQDFSDANQGFLLVKLKSSLRKFTGRLPDLVNRGWNICVTNDHG